jgi:hypothetical protein
LGEEVDIRNESSLQNNWDVTGVEQLNRVWLSETSLLSSLELKYNLEVLEINYNEHHQYSGQKITNIRRVLPLERLIESIYWVRFCKHEVEQSNNGTLEFSSLVGSNCNGGERFPHDGLADVSGNEKGDT